MINKDLLKLIFGYLISSCSGAMCMDDFSTKTKDNNLDTNSDIQVIKFTKDDLWGSCYYKEEDIIEDIELIKKHTTIEYPEEGCIDIKCLPFHIRVPKKDKIVDNVIPHLTRMYKIYAMTASFKDSLTQEKINKYAKDDTIKIDSKLLCTNTVNVKELIEKYHDIYDEEVSQIDDRDIKILECMEVLDETNLASKDIIEYIHAILDNLKIRPQISEDHECFKMMEKYTLDCGLTNNVMLKRQMFKLHENALKAYIGETITITRL